MAKRTKLETVYNYKRLTAVIREVYSDSGRTKRVWVRLDAPSRESLELQVKGAMDYIIAEWQKETVSHA